MAQCGAGAVRPIRPSRQLQPKFNPRPAAGPRTKSSSSRASWPTSPISSTAGDPVEAEAPRIAEPVAPDLIGAGAVEAGVGPAFMEPDWATFSVIPPISTTISDDDDEMTTRTRTTTGARSRRSSRAPVLGGRIVHPKTGRCGAFYGWTRSSQCKMPATLDGAPLSSSNCSAVAVVGVERRVTLLGAVADHGDGVVEVHALGVGLAGRGRPRCVAPPRTGRASPLRPRPVRSG